MYENGVTTCVENTHTKYKYTVSCCLASHVCSVIFFIAGVDALLITRPAFSILTRLQLHGICISFISIITHLQTFGEL